MIAATTVKTMVESLKFPREVAATRVHSLIAASHGPPHPVETVSPKKAIRTASSRGDHVSEGNRGPPEFTLSLLPPRGPPPSAERKL